MQPDVDEPIGMTEPLCADRIGFARLTTMAFGGTDLRPLRDELLSKVAGGTAGAGEGLDLSLIAQLLGDKQTGIAIQAEVLAFHQLFPLAVCRGESETAGSRARRRDRHGGNTPIEFLLEESGIELLTLYVVAGAGLPVPLPDHDVAIVIASDLRGMPRCACDRRTSRAALAAADAQSAATRRPSGSRQTASSAPRNRRIGYPGDDRRDAGKIVRRGSVDPVISGYCGRA